ncbi:probable serine/threonine-protein phosphatase 2a regulatory subunit b'' subunit ton2 [Phtheirospermum japonicum]|uniref:Probable serine/threonine-protein phosphatase 2a regulatory subunit b'' subunit ton2 n=1 Tax=Phtheirospermum japonicum TaxID=374723 RepID=A0A830C564_9LAMI|nr:probable serine/threonine-protein phosphatase 2a regulatory subunit b'' subunit ton2 [Phtheirospermum japonicum]
MKCVVAAGQEHMLGEFGRGLENGELEMGRSSIKNALYALAEMIEKWDANGGGRNKGLRDEEREALRSLLKMLREVEEFYDCIGGIIGQLKKEFVVSYQMKVLELLAQSTDEGSAEVEINLVVDIDSKKYDSCADGGQMKKQGFKQDVFSYLKVGSPQIDKSISHLVSGYAVGDLTGNKARMQLHLNPVHAVLQPLLKVNYFVATNLAAASSKLSRLVCLFWSNCLGTMNVVLQIRTGLTVPITLAAREFLNTVVTDILHLQELETKRILLYIFKVKQQKSAEAGTIPSFYKKKQSDLLLNVDDLDAMWVCLRENCVIDDATGAEKCCIFLKFSFSMTFMTWTTYPILKRVNQQPSVA